MSGDVAGEIRETLQLESQPTSRQRAAILIRAAMQALDAAGGELPVREILKEVEQRVELTSYDRFVFEKTGYIRWQSLLYLWSIDFVKAGFLRKAKGRWFLTEEGRAVLSKTPEIALSLAQKAYIEWKAQQSEKISAATDDSIAEVAQDVQAPNIERAFVFETAEAQALQEIRDYLLNLGPYEFQDLVAALLRGMGYSTPFVAPRGPDRGTDILAYRDPLGTQAPHIRTQVKHRKEKATRDEIAALRGIVRSDREIGLFVSIAGFTTEAQREASQGSAHIELIDLDRFLDLWLMHYEKLIEEDKAFLRLRRVFFLAPE